MITERTLKKWRTDALRYIELRKMDTQKTLGVQFSERNHLKVIVTREGEHIKCTVFSGNENQTLANCGKLVFRVGEYQLFMALLTMGYSTPGTIKDHLLFTVDGEEEALDD
jgi:hypothetical protein